MDDDEEFGRYVAARWTRLVRSAVLLGCAGSEAEDVVQTALERCLLSWSRVSSARDRDAYVHRVLVNTFVSARRRRWRGERATERLPETSVAPETDRVDDADAMLRALGRLPHEQRCVVVLRYYSHLTEQQTATALGIAPGTAKSRLSRALTRLAEDPSLVALRGAP